MRIHRLRSCWRLRAGKCTMISGRSTHTRTHTHSNTRTHAHIHTYIHTHRYPCTHTHTCIYSSYIRIIHMYYIYTYIPSIFAYIPSIYIHPIYIRSRRKSDLKYLDLQIYPISGYICGVTQTPFTHMKSLLKLWGLP